MKITKSYVNKNLINICDVEGGTIVKYEGNYYLVSNEDLDSNEETCLINLENGKPEYISFSEDVELIDYEFNVFN